MRIIDLPPRLNSGVTRIALNGFLRSLLAVELCVRQRVGAPNQVQVDVAGNGLSCIAFNNHFCSTRMDCGFTLRKATPIPTSGFA